MTELRLAIDPRLRQRLIEVRHEEGRRRLRVLIVAGCVVFAGVLGWGVTRSPLLRVAHVRIQGISRTAAGDVLAHSGLSHHRQMMDLDTGAIGTAIAALPWIDTVRVQRSWPATVTIAITERQPVAAVADRSGGVALVDHTGRVLAIVAGVPAGMTLIALQSTPPTSPAPPVPAQPTPLAAEPGTTLPVAMSVGLSVASALRAPLTSQVATVTVITDGSVELSLSGGAKAELGTSDDLEAKLIALDTVLARVRVGHGTIDLRVPSAPVLTPPTP